MFKKVAETLVSVAISGIALFIVGKIAYETGVNVSNEQVKYMMLKAKCDELEAKCAKMSEKAAENGIDLAAEVEEIRQEIAVAKDTRPEPAKRIGGLGFVPFVKGFLSKKNPSPIKRMVEAPQDFKIEAYLQGDEIHVNAKPKGALA